MLSLYRRDSMGLGDGSLGYGPTALLAVSMLAFTTCIIATLLYFLRQRRRAAKRYAQLPAHPRGHHRTLTITTHPSTTTNGDSIFVYDEKMNLIANAGSAPQSPVPEIHVTFPDEEGKGGDKKSGGVFVVCISDSGSIGMKPLHQDTLPPYRSQDAERLQSLDLERIGGLKEQSSLHGSRWS